jgi:hypothetical protein
MSLLAAAEAAHSSATPGRDGVSRRLRVHKHSLQKKISNEYAWLYATEKSRIKFAMNLPIQLLHTYHENVLIGGGEKRMK